MASDLVLHCFPMPHTFDARLIWGLRSVRNVCVFEPAHSRSLARASFPEALATQAQIRNDSAIATHAFRRMLSACDKSRGRSNEMNVYATTPLSHGPSKICLQLQRLILWKATCIIAETTIAPCQ